MKKHIEIDLGQLNRRAIDARQGVYPRVDGLVYEIVRNRCQSGGFLLHMWVITDTIEGALGSPREDTNWVRYGDK